MSGLSFETAWVMALGVPAVVLAIAYFASRQRARPRRQRWTLAALRGSVLLLLVLLLARPVWIAPYAHDEPRRRVALLIDRSESMSLADDGEPRLRRAIAFARDQLVPALAREGLEAGAFLFAESVQAAGGEEIADARAEGQDTNLAAAISQAVSSESPPPLAVIALTDGIATRRAETTQALTALVENRVPFIGVGFGTDQDPASISVEEILAPSRVPPRQEFRIAVKLQAMGVDELPAFELLLERDGRLVERKRVAAMRPPRIWQETFTVAEEEAGRYHYRVRTLLPSAALVRSTRTEAEAVVTVSDEQHWKTLFVQGGLTWDYKFLRLATHSDPAIELACLSRTSQESHFFQALDDKTLSDGFPKTDEELAAFRTVILANLRPFDLRPPQQELLVRYCRDGGGVLMLGGPETFNVAWRDSPLEQLLPVRFHATPRAIHVAPFALQLTADAQRHPVFQLNDGTDPLAAWRAAPLFTEFAQVDAVKAGAQVWLECPQQLAPTGRPPIMAVQQYGAGRSAALCIATLWRWRLAKHADPQHFDRFWQQLIRYLGGGHGEAVQIHLADQPLEPGTVLKASLELRSFDRPATPSFVFRVESAEREVLHEQTVTLADGRLPEIAFRVPEAGLYTLTVRDSGGIVQGSRTVELKDVQREFARLRRDLDHLRQWASLSHGQAVAAEECTEPAKLIESLNEHARTALQQQPLRYPAGIHGGTLTLIVLCLGAEWLLRKRWGWR